MTGKMQFVKFGLLVATVVLSTLSAKAQDFNYACLNSPETAYYQVIDQQDQIKVRVNHLYGPAAMPIFEGLISINDLGRIAKFAPVLASIGPMLEFNFPKANCTRKGEYLFQCQDYKNASVVMMNGHKVRGLSFYTQHMQFDTVDLSYELLQMNLYLEIDGEPYFFPMRYNPRDCSKPTLR